MELFRKFAVGAFDVACARLAINAQHLIGITHPPWTPFDFGGQPRRQMLFDSLMWDLRNRPAIRWISGGAENVVPLETKSPTSMASYSPLVREGGDPAVTAATEFPLARE